MRLMLRILWQWKVYAHNAVHILLVTATMRANSNRILDGAGMEAKNFEKYRGRYFYAGKRLRVNF